MDHPIRGLHHVTATVGDAQQDLDFYVKLLGLRLVKRTVNFDNHDVYHFYYGNALGEPSTIMTTFPYAGWNVREGSKGAGQVTTTSFSVPAASLPFWRERLSGAGVAIEEGGRYDLDTLRFDDPSRLSIELIGTTDDPRQPWVTDAIGTDAAIHGLYGVTLTVRDAAATLSFLIDVLGAETIKEDGARTLVALHGTLPGYFLEVLSSTDAPAAVNGTGTVHHVALAIDGGDAQVALREHLLGLGYKVTDVRDRQYFTSIYFREPGGVLYEVATLKPGFTVDEAPETLGTSLKLPPWEEPNRASIERNLPPVSV